MDNYNERILIEKVAIAAENSKMQHLERNKYNEGDVVQLTNWISKLSLRNHNSKERNQRKEKSIKEQRHDIKGVITNGNHKICYVKIIEIVNERKDIEAQQEIRLPYDYVIKQYNFFKILFQYI